MSEGCQVARKGDKAKEERREKEKDTEESERVKVQLAAVRCAE